MWQQPCRHVRHIDPEPREHLLPHPGAEDGIPGAKVDEEEIAATWVHARNGGRGLENGGELFAAISKNIC